MNLDDVALRQYLKAYKQICVYGLSPDEKKPSHYVPVYMRQHGYDVVGVYPDSTPDHGFHTYRELKQVPAAWRRFILVFRRAEKIPALVDEILDLGGTEFLWLQLGIFHPPAETKAEAAGLKVVSNRCAMIEHQAR